MGAFFETIPASLMQWLLEQKVFWVATAPLSAACHINLSPKGGAYFGLLDERTFWYMDLTGSGNETISHLYENGRITVLFNAFEGPPRILRLWGTGTVLERGTPEFARFVKERGVETIPATRCIVRVDVHQVGTSCGFSVPFYDFKAFRPTLNDLFAQKAVKFDAGNEKESMPRYWAFKNAWSVDGLPGMHIGRATGAQEGIAPMKKMVGRSALVNGRRRGAAEGFTLIHLILVALVSALLSALVTLRGAEIVQSIRSKAF